MWSGSYKRPHDETTWQGGGKRFRAGNERERRKQYIDDMYERLSLDADDKKKSRAYVDEILGKVIKHVREQEDGKIYGHQIIKAGSFPINAKIGKADEFDTNVLLNIEPKRIYRSGYLNYDFTDVGNQSADPSSMYTDLRLVRTNGRSVNIPNGYAVVAVGTSEVPSEFVHFSPTTAVVINKSEQSGCIDLIPRDVKQDLHQKIKRAKSELDLNEVSISITAQGPALTLTISPQRESNIHHKISVDVTVSLKCASKVKFEDFGWPREQTKKAFDQDIIDAAIEAGIHLVPKKNLFWSVSFSRAERAILSSIDRGFAYRKRVLKQLKKYVENCRSSSTSKLPGISSHILKTQILWSCELHANNTSYWNHDNRDVCLITTMEELEIALRRRNLAEYFNKSLNVLDGKDPMVLDELANYLSNERTKLKQII